MSELEEKIARLPVWARDHIRLLNIRAQPAIEECAKARREAETAKERCRKLSDANSALMEILSKAGQGGHDFARVVHSTLDSYEIFRNVNPDPQS